jgi:hypothetical protein
VKKVMKGLKHWPLVVAVALGALTFMVFTAPTVCHQRAHCVTR